MTIKKLTFCFLYLANAANLAEEEDFNEENSSKTVVEDNVFINKNSWNTRKWGSIYFLFPQVSGDNIGGCEFSILGRLENHFAMFLNVVLSGVVEYKYMFNKSFGINARFNLNKLEVSYDDDNIFISFEPSIEWIYGRKGKNIFSGSFSLIGFGFMQKDDGSLVNNFCKRCWTFGFVLLKYEYDRRFYLNFGKVKTTWYNLQITCKKYFWIAIGFNLLSIEFGLNIVGVNDGRKKRENINAKL